MENQKIVAVDNLWNPKADLLVQKIGGKPKKIIMDSKIFLNKNSKLEGKIVYFLPKDASGKLIGSPIRLLNLTRGGASTDKYVSGDKVVPYYQDILNNKAYWGSLSGGSEQIALAENKVGGGQLLASNFTGMDDLRNTMDKIGFDSSLDVSNVQGLDESISSRFTNESLLGFTNESLLGFTNESLLNQFGADGENSSQFTNESLLGFTNESLLNQFGADGEEQSNGIGDWFKSVFSKDDKSGSATNKIADPNVAVVSEETLTEAYKESGSKKPLGEWINSEGGKSVIDSITQAANLFKKPTAAGKPESIMEKTSETKILGMSPITFGLVAFGVIAVGSIVAVSIIKSKK